MSHPNPWLHPRTLPEGLTAYPSIQLHLLRQLHPNTLLTLEAARSLQECTQGHPLHPIITYTPGTRWQPHFYACASCGTPHYYLPNTRYRITTGVPLTSIARPRKLR